MWLTREAFGTGLLFQPQGSIVGPAAISLAEFRVARRRLAHRPERVLFISSDIPELGRIRIELAQPCWLLRANGTRLVDKYAGGVSPNLADAVMMALHPRRVPMRISDDVIAAI